MIVEKVLTFRFLKRRPEALTDQQRETKRSKGEKMDKQYLKILFSVVCFAGMGITAAAQGRDQIVVTLPFQSVVSGQILPAGRYIVSRVSDDKLEGLTLSSYENHTSVIVHPVDVQDASEDNPQVSFTKVAGEHFLSRIQTAFDIYNIPCPACRSWKPQPVRTTTPMLQRAPHHPNEQLL
jgi:hypothetical protein